MGAYPLAPSPWGNGTSLGIAASTVVKTAPGVVITVAITTAGTTAGAVYDTATTSGNIAANLVASLPNTVGLYQIGFPCVTGILIVPGSGQVVSVAYA